MRPEQLGFDADLTIAALTDLVSYAAAHGDGHPG
jgi:2-haloacid dehalogenase